MEGAPPNRLGGDSFASGGNVPLTPDEIRRRRLAVLDQRAAVPTSITTSPPHLTINTSLGDASSSAPPNDADELDEELQAALALSLQDVTAETSASVPAVVRRDMMDSEFEESYLNDEVNTPMLEAPLFDPVDLGKAIQGVYERRQPLDSMLQYHKLLWDDQLTADSDKDRWISQGIDVRNGANDTAGNTNSSYNERQGKSTMEAIASSHSAWGLVQHHGGPCGVLAAIQAEMLRILLFTDGEHRGHVAHSTDQSPSIPIRTALARAIAIVLARAAITPSSVSNESVKDEKAPSFKASVDHGAAVRIVLPTAVDNRELTWHDLEPWHFTPGCAESSSALTVYTFDEASLDLLSPVAVSTTTTETDSDATTSKRQKVVLPSENGISSSSTHLSSKMRRIQRMACVVEAFLLDESRGKTSMVSAPPLDSFRQKGGVLLLVLSIVASRTIPVIQEEFDDPVGTRLTGQFGHCSQELINLLLTGQAVSNVFDNTLSPSGDMVCRGIQSRPAVGYLTQLESMRYCEVGGYYKMPLYPIWVVGSQSHFTVLFGDLAALKESKSDMLLDECRRAFKAVEGGEENGFIQTDQLPMVLKRLNINIGGLNEFDESARIQALAASLEVTGTSIILWDDFWKAASRLLTGASLEAVLHSGNGVDVDNPIIVDGSDQPPPLLTNYAANDFQVKPEARRPAAAAAATKTSFIESDEEMARRLAAEWEKEGASGMMALSNAAELHNSGLKMTSMDIDQPSGSMGDEELARILQQQYDSENAVDAALSGGENASVRAMSGSPFPMLSDIDETNSLSTTPTRAMFSDVDTGKDDDAKPAAQLAMSTESLPFEQYGDTFSLYHYNGLRGGVLTPFRITRLTAEEAVGASIALNRNTSASSHGASGSQDLEDVVRTKWPSCSINWLGNSPPFID